MAASCVGRRPPLRVQPGRREARFFASNHRGLYRLLPSVGEEADAIWLWLLKELTLQARLAAVRRGSDQVSREDLEAALGATREHMTLATRGLQDRGQVGFGAPSV